MSWFSSIGLCEDAGGEPLQRLLLDPPLEVGRFLRLVISIAMALGELHKRGLVHKDIKPVNILVNGATGDARPTGSTLHLATRTNHVVSTAAMHSRIPQRVKTGNPQNE